MAKGITLIVFAIWVIASTIWHWVFGTLQHPAMMGAVGFAALLANRSVALLLYRFRTGDANMRSVWICWRNDALGNLAVMLASLGVFDTGTGWPDVMVAAIIGGLGLPGGRQISRQAVGGLRATDAIDHANEQPRHDEQAQSFRSRARMNIQGRITAQFAEIEARRG